MVGVDEDDDDGVDDVAVVAAGFDDGGRFRDVFAMMKKSFRSTNGDPAKMNGRYHGIGDM